MLENLGIPSTGLEYHKIFEGQNLIEEHVKTVSFLGRVVLKMIESEPGLLHEEAPLRFINYGDTQLVYVLSSKDKDYTLLVGQPNAEYGIVKQEFDNLNKLSDIVPELIVKPDYYFSEEDRELYVAPYIEQARCIASFSSSWGLYVPEPRYRFEAFSEQEESVVNRSMIANLVRLYDDKNELGIASCKIGGGDFILEKAWSKEEKTIDNTLRRMKLIAARALKQFSFDEYISTIENEFSQSTYYYDIKDRDESIIINHKSRLPMNREDILEGIELGIKLRP